MTKGYLDILKGTTNEDIEEFTDTFEVPSEISGFDPNEETGGLSPELKEETFEKVKINHGAHGDDYVWHISPAHPKASFKQPPDNIIRLIVTIMNKMIPEHIQVQIFPPEKDWEIKEYTFKAERLVDCWQITTGHIQECNKEIGRVLSLIL